MQVLKRIGVSAMAALVALSVLTVPVFAQGQGLAEESGTYVAAPSGSKELRLNGVHNKSAYSYSAVPIYYRGTKLAVSGRMINSELYLPMRAVVERATGISVNYDSKTRTSSVFGGGYNISVTDGAYALFASGRVMFSMTPAVILSDGRMYVPASSLLRALSLSHTASGGNVNISGTPAPVKSADQYYAEDAVYWLARIISAESRGESLLGQIAVGTVVMNRVESPSFPNTIWGVIFDKKYGVQFSPVSNGTIYQAPTSTAILAAKICLEGFRTPGEPIYFLRPSASTSSWIVQNRPYAYTIGNHYFVE